MVPNKDCRMLLNIIGARKIRNGLRRDVFDTKVFPVDRCGGSMSRMAAFELNGRDYSRCGDLASLIAIGEPDDMVANIGRPAGDLADEAPPVVGEQGASGVLEMRQIACHR